MSVIINGDTGIDKITDGSVVQADLASGVASTGPAFSAYIGSAQTVSASTTTKLQFNTEIFDTASAYDNSTDYRFTPLVAGYYQVNIGFIGANSTDTLVILYKTGTEYGSSGSYQPSFGGRPRYTALVYLNGSTDYLEAYAYVGGNTAVSTGANASEFSASLVRAV